MNELGPPDCHYLSAALGWLELGNAPEARAELSRVSAEMALHPEVLGARWLLHAREQEWDEGLVVAQSEIAASGDSPAGWLHRAYALRRVRGGGLQAAWDALRPAYDQFPGEPTIAYNLACYACQMRNLDEARRWLKCAMKTGGKQAIRRLALSDPDLEALRGELEQEQSSG